ncbi:MAG: queuosine precursor transporter, partial [Desulfobacterales bacterium]|nr:queuosine precursor transporter [Desulfobacterales bacterium]
MNAMPSDAAAPVPVPVAGILVVGLYIAAQMLADVASLKIALVAGFSIDAGTFVYPLTFTLRDLVHKRLGLAAARTVVLLAAAVNLFMALFFQFAVRLPEDPAWGLGREFAAILGPVWRIVTASIVAEVVSEFLDTELYRWWVARVTPRFQWMRVLVSNSLSIPLDSLIF